jgi:hypothetical protein
MKIVINFKTLPVHLELSPTMVGCAAIEILADCPRQLGGVDPPLPAQEP